MNTVEIVRNFAFLTAVYDHSCLDTIQPALPGDCIGYHVYVWDTEIEAFSTDYELIEYEGEALKLAQDAHNNCLKELLHSTYQVPDYLIDESAKIAELDAEGEG